jgi:hypothetical protein
MTKISDTDLMAYADGVLPKHLRPLVRRALLEDPALLEKLEGYIITHRGLAAPFDRLPPISDRLRKALATAPQATDPAEEGWWRLLWKAMPQKRWRAGFPLSAWSVAAVGLLVCAAMFAFPLKSTLEDRQRLADLEANGLVLSAPFQRALETTQSNVDAPLAVLKPTGTFLSTENEWCRQYQLVQQDATLIAGVACRDRAGAWQVKMVEVVAATPAANGYAPAGNGHGGHPVDRLETTLNRLMKDVVLLPSDEKRLIGGGWLPN